MQIKPLDILVYTSCKYPLIKQKNEKDLFSKFKTGDVFLSLNETDKKKSSKNAKAIVGALLFMGAVTACILKRKSIFNVIKENSL